MIINVLPDKIIGLSVHNFYAGSAKYEPLPDKEKEFFIKHYIKFYYPGYILTEYNYLVPGHGLEITIYKPDDLVEIELEIHITDIDLEPTDFSHTTEEINTKILDQLEYDLPGIKIVHYSFNYLYNTIKVFGRIEFKYVNQKINPSFKRTTRY